ncbi:aldehyde dehydrogenase family protein [Bordetella petrii]|uniref:aldehyde dehydrogenase family protein n=1 Tax=Bordetella petrii TaxID=94624 RepID=UPI00372E3480
MPHSNRPAAAPPNTGNLIDGAWRQSELSFTVHDKYTGLPCAEVAQASAAQVAEAVRAARAAVDAGAPPPYDRARTLRRAAQLLDSHRQRLVDTMVAEAGFTLADANGEIDRASITLELSAEEGVRLTGDMIPFAASPGAHQRLGFTQRFPVGVVCAITPFNSPLNTVLHKVAPAYAAGNAVILKPSAYTPLTGALLGELLLEAGMPPGFLAILQGDGDTVGTALLAEQDIDFYTFTGSTRVGRIIQQAAGLRRTQMELGSIASTLVCADADLDRAIPRIANAALRKAGQVCTSVQRLYVERPILQAVTERLVEHARGLQAGDPRDPATRVGPLISEAAAIRAESWLRAAEAAGARLLCGGRRERAVIQPAVLTDVAETQQLWCQEAFAPLLSIRPFDAFEAALDSANGTPYGLSAGVFTRDLERAMLAGRRLRFGTVQINETSSARSDVMPFGGVKDSGFGKEGPAHAIREMTEERLLVFNP